MGIELQSAPQGHQRVGSNHSQAGKATDASQLDSPFGFAALMSLMSDQAPANSVAQESSSLGPDTNTALIPGELLGSAVVGLPFLSQPPTASQLSASGKDTSQNGNLAGAVDLSLTQAAIQVAGQGVPPPDIPPESLGQPGLAQPGTGAVVATTTDGLASMTTMDSARLVQPTADLKSALDAQAPVSAMVQAEQARMIAKRAASDQSTGPDTKLVVVSAELNGEGLAQTSEQIVLAGAHESATPAATPKPGGSWASQQAMLAGVAQKGANEFAGSASGLAGLGSSTASAPILLFNPQEAGIRLSERPAKHLSNRYGSASDGVYGQPMTASNAADTLFQVAPTSAAVASTAVAETVSYWASQGVQNASLQLDGFGDEPVEVRISVTGDMAQVDFRTNQPEVRQAIEAAASQLKDMLSSQGMQLAGMSIGTSGRGGAQDRAPRPPSDFRKVTLMKSEAVETVRTRGANPAVGQSLDLFV